jgi:hypothetical protein
VSIGISNHHNNLHAYLRDTRIADYTECRSCRSKTKSMCMKCGHCYTCHSLLLKDQPTPPQQQRKVLDVYGREIEPICSYRTCRHKFSLHNTHRCKCRHAFNYAAGISLWSK